MEKYKFSNYPIIFYLYEPLFELNCDSRYQIYNKVFNNLKKIKEKVYIIYISATSINKLIYNCNDILLNNFNLLYKKNISLYPFDRNIYMFTN